MKPPAFQFYADRFLAGTMNMTDAEVGLYIRLLCAQWSVGSVPDDDQELASYGKGGTPIQRVKAKFEKGPDGLLRNAMLETVRREQDDYREKQRQKGLASGRARMSQNEPRFNRGSTAVQPRLPSGCLPVPTGGEPEANPTSTPTPTSTEDKKKSAANAALEEEIGFNESHPLNCPEFREAWNDWARHRKEKKKPITALAAQKQLAELSEMGLDRAMIAISFSIKNGYQGIFEPQGPNRKPADATPDHSKDFWDGCDLPPLKTL
jgi:hypothetical protein